MGLQPYGGCRQIYEVECYEGGPVSGASGNPIRIGWYISGDETNNSFLFFQPLGVPTPKWYPQWGIMYHELGHNFTMDSDSHVFIRGLDDPPSNTYREGIATLISLTSMERILNNAGQFPITDTTKYSIEWLYERDIGDLEYFFQEWYDSERDFGSIDANIIDGMWLNYKNSGGSEFATRFFFPLKPQYEPALETVLQSVESAGLNGKHTFFAALVSAALAQDLSSEFINTYYFPIDQTLFDQAYQVLLNILPCAIIVTSPEEDEDWVIGDTETIEWRSSKVTGNVKIRRTNPETCSGWSLITEVSVADESYNWEVTEPAQQNCIIKVTSVDDQDCYGESKLFNIVVGTTTTTIPTTSSSTTSSTTTTIEGTTKWHDWFAPGDETPHVGDFNGDGLDDIVAFMQGGGGLNRVWVSLSTGSSFGGSAIWHENFAPAGTTPHAGDFNGDGLDDIIEFSQGSSGDVFVSLSE